MALWPGLAISIVAYSINMFGDNESPFPKFLLNLWRGINFGSNYLGYFRAPFNLSTGFARHKVQNGHYALESSKVY